MNNIWPYDVPGIPDDMFIRRDVPMTKREIRCLAISAMRLRNSSIVWDIGAGTGSVSVEAAIIAKNGRVYAVEKDAQALALIQQNAERFELDNIEAVYGEAPDILEKLPAPDSVFIGGSGGYMGSIMNTCGQHLRSGGTLVINCISLENAALAIEAMRACGFIGTDIIQAAISRGSMAGCHTMLKALNPIFIISGRRGDEIEG
jgi:cobalt-precorrin-6B (C15)-methyltransferase